MINDKKLVTWLLCTNKVNSLLFRAIDSCLNQSIDNFEVLIVVNGCDCVSVKSSIQKKYNDPRIKLITTSIKFLNFSLNLGLHHCNTEFVARMDADDVAGYDRLERQVQYLIENPNVSLVGSSYFLIDSECNVLDLVELPASNSEIKSALYYANPICHPSIMFRRDIILQNGGYLGGMHSEDYELWVRLSLDPNFIFANLKEPLTSYSVVGGEARGSRMAYINTAAVQFKSFLITWNIKWVFGMTLSVFKRIIRS